MGIYQITSINITAQVFRLKAEDYKLSRNARIKPFNTFSVSTTLALIIHDGSLAPSHPSPLIWGRDGRGAETGARSPEDPMRTRAVR